MQLNVKDLKIEDENVLIILKFFLLTIIDL